MTSPLPPSDVTRFVILFEGRTGSSHLISLLDSHPLVRAGTEIISGHLALSGEEERAMVRGELDIDRRDDAVAIGFKTKLSDIREKTEMARVFRESGVRVIRLRRANEVKIAVSVLNERVLRARNELSNATSTIMRTEPLVAEPAVIEGLIRQRRAFDDALDAFVQEIAQPTLEVLYEDLLADQDRVTHEVLEFLDVPPAPLRSRVVKNTSDDLRDSIRNFEELQRHFRGTEFESQLREAVPAAAWKHPDPDSLRARTARAIGTARRIRGKVRRGIARRLHPITARLRQLRPRR